MKLIILFIGMMSTLTSFAVDFGSSTLKDLEAKPKSQMLSVGSNVSKNIRTELSVGLTITPNNSDIRSSVAVNLTYNMLRSAPWEINMQTGINYQNYMIDTDTNYYGTVGLELVRQISHNKYYVFEINRKLTPGSNQSEHFFGPGWVIITGIRYKF